MEELLSSAIANYVFNHLIDDVVNKPQPIKRKHHEKVSPKTIDLWLQEFPWLILTDEIMYFVFSSLVIHNVSLK